MPITPVSLLISYLLIINRFTEAIHLCACDPSFPTSLSTVFWNTKTFAMFAILPCNLAHCICIVCKCLQQPYPQPDLVLMWWVETEARAKWRVSGDYSYKRLVGSFVNIFTLRCLFASLSNQVIVGWGMIQVPILRTPQAQVIVEWNGTGFAWIYSDPVNVAALRNI